MTDEEMCRLLRDDRLEFLEFAPEIAARLEALRAERDAEKWRVDNWRKCFEQQQERAKKAEARAEKAEAEAIQMRSHVQFARNIFRAYAAMQREKRGDFWEMHARAADSNADAMDRALAPVEAKEPKQSP